MLTSTGIKPKGKFAGQHKLYISRASAVLWFCLATAVPVSGHSAEAYGCGGSVEMSVWQLWDKQARAYLRDTLLNKRLIEERDAYALYDTQTYLHNLVAMSRRCGRIDRLIELADELSRAYQALEPLRPWSNDVAWICKGGKMCSTHNRLQGKEVLLFSVQGLGLLSSLADALANSNEDRARKHPFVDKTVEISVQHLLRWGGIGAVEDSRRRLAASPRDVKTEGSELFFTDKDLWQIGIYANLAGIFKATGRDKRQDALSKQLRPLLDLFASRTSLETIRSPYVGEARVADIDRGFWRLHSDNRYAGYTADAAPAACAKSGIQQFVRPKEVPVVDTLGWDISHARRLVHVLEALDRNRTAIMEVYGIGDSLLWRKNDLTKAFAAQLVAKVWNGDKAEPRFTNYWSGANGWYRVGFSGGAAACNGGYPPFGLSKSFATGGYAVWAKHYPIIGELARTLYTKATADAGGKRDNSGARKTPSGGGMTYRELDDLMFWPSLVQ